MASVDDHDGLTSEVAASFADLRYVATMSPEHRLLHVSVHPQLSQQLFPAEPDHDVRQIEGLLVCAQLLAKWQELSEFGTSTELNCEHQTATGGQVWLHHRFTLRRTTAGATIIVGAARDITAEVVERNRIAESANLYREVAENSADFAMRTTPERVIEYVSDSVTGVLGWTPAELLGVTVPSLIHPDDQEMARYLSARLNQGETVFLHTRFRTKSGRYIWMAQHVKPIFGADGTVVARAGVWRDVTAEVVAQKALAQSEERFRLAMRSAPEGVALIGPNREFLAVNPALCRILKRDERWLLTHGMADILHPEDDQLEQSLHQARTEIGEEAPTAELRCIRADGATVWVKESVGTLRAPEGEETSVVHFVDISESRAAAERLRFLAQHDDLTGQLRPAALTARLEAMLERRREQAVGQLVVIFVDVDGLKAVNDSLGHEAGDEVIRVAAQRIASTVRSSDVVARIGGDEFVIVLDAVRQLSDALTVADKLQENFGRPIAVREHGLTMSLSMGVAVAESADSADDLLRRADVALYASKRSGRARATVYSPQLETH